MQCKTYQEAKIANPKIDIFTKKREGIFKAIKNPETNHFIDGWQICKPENHCISLESFLASGKRLVRGDLFIGSKGKVSVVASPTAMNDPQDVDSDIYILKAKALENPAHEWANGDECVHVDYPNCVYIYIGKHPHKDGGYVFQEDRVIGYVDNNCLRKPETTEQKLDRQRLESAYHLACIAGAVDKWGGEFTFDNFKQDWEAVKRWLAVVDETKYLLND